MGFFDRFKKNKNANKKVKRVERKRKAIDKQPDIEESQLALREIAVNSKNRHKRAQATDSITNQYVALDIAKHVTDRAIRLIAANKIQDEDLLWDAAENAEFYDVRSFAYERLGENNKSIAEIVINQKKNQHVTEIFEKIEDEETLKDIAVSAVDRKFRKLALEKIDTQEILESIAFEAKDNEIRKLAVNKGNFYNEDVLQKVAVEDRDDGVRIAAVNKINDESKLVEIAKNEENTKVRNVLLSKIVNPELLEEIALTSQTEIFVWTW